jgi:hypothetical protein
VTASYLLGATLVNNVPLTISIAGILPDNQPYEEQILVGQRTFIPLEVLISSSILITLVNSSTAVTGADVYVTFVGGSSADADIDEVAGTLRTMAGRRGGNSGMAPLTAFGDGRFGVGPGKAAEEDHSDAEVVLTAVREELGRAIGAVKSKVMDSAAGARGGVKRVAHTGLDLGEQLMAGLSRSGLLSGARAKLTTAKETAAREAEASTGDRDSVPSRAQVRKAAELVGAVVDTSTHQTKKNKKKGANKSSKNDRTYTHTTATRHDGHKDTGTRN